VGKEQNKIRKQMFRVRHEFATKSTLFIVHQNIRSTGTSQIPTLGRFTICSYNFAGGFSSCVRNSNFSVPALNFNHKNSILQKHHKTQTHKYCPHRRRQHHRSKRFRRQPAAETGAVADCRRLFHSRRCCSHQRHCRGQTGDNASMADAATAATAAKVAAADTADTDQTANKHHRSYSFPSTQTRQKRSI
jgi:hypothetical protein